MLRSLFLKKLAILALSDDLHHAILYCRLVESMYECLADDRAS
jgi:hypothetical protein